MGEHIFAYWVVNIETGIHTHFLDCDFYDIGEIITREGVEYRVEDLALDRLVSAEELKDSVY